MSPSAPERRLQRLEWTVVRRLDGLLQGDYRTIFKGQGLDLADIREYAFGDDVRHIDWNVTARLDAPYVREYLEDREINAHFLLDLSPSVDSGTVDRLERISRRHETLAIRLADPREDELPDIGTVILTDSETGEQLRVNTGDQRFRERFAQAARRREESLNATFARAGVDVLVLRTDEDLVRAIVRFAYWRKRRAGRRAARGASA